MNIDEFYAPEAPHDFIAERAKRENGHFPVAGRPEFVPPPLREAFQIARSSCLARPRVRACSPDGAPQANVAGFNLAGRTVARDSARGP